MIFNKMLLGMMTAMVIGGYFYYNTTQAKLETLQNLNAAYEVKVKTQDETILEMERSYTNQSEALSELTIKYSQASEEMKRYLDIFRRHDFSKLAAAKPGLIENRVNEATRNVFTSLEEDSSFITPDPVTE